MMKPNERIEILRNEYNRSLLGPLPVNLDHSAVTGNNLVYGCLALACMALLICSIASATNLPQGGHHDATAISGSTAKSNAHANAKSQSVAGAAALSGSIAAGGSGGSSDQSQTATGGNAALTDASSTTSTNTLAGGTQSATTGSQAITESSSVLVEDARQTPWVILPSILTSDCGSGVNAGGSKAGGAGAFGFTWTTDKCYDFKGGNNWVAIGAIEEACVLWLDVNRKAFARQKHTPDCKAIAARVYEAQRPAAAQPAVDLTPYATKAEVERIFKQSQSK